MGVLRDIERERTVKVLSRLLEQGKALEKSEDGKLALLHIPRSRVEVRNLMKSAGVLWLGPAPMRGYYSVRKLAGGLQYHKLRLQVEFVRELNEYEKSMKH